MLIVRHDVTVWLKAGGSVPSNWAICTHNPNWCLVYGFGRKRDAEIALEVLTRLGINTTSGDEMETRWKEAGERAGVMKQIAEALQW